MFTNLTKPEGRRKGKRTSEGKGAEKKREMSGEKEWERKVGEGGTDEILGSTRLFSLSTFDILHAKPDTLFHKVIITFPHSSPKGP